jgi:hypothetical protein
MGWHESTHLNCDLYSLLFAIENSLRELIIDEMESAFGPRWWKTRVNSEDIKRPFKEAVAYERGFVWMSSIAFHPIYYTAFTDLEQIIFKRDNWREVFRKIFVDEVVLKGLLREIEPIRNKVAHNRLATQYDLEVITAKWSTIRGMIGDKRIEELSGRSTRVTTISSTLAKLREELIHEVQLCIKLQPPQGSASWTQVNSAWWFEDDYLGADLQCIRKTMQKVQDFTNLPRNRGAILTLTNWLESSNIEQLAESSEHVLDTLIQSAQQNPNV